MDEIKKIFDKFGMDFDDDKKDKYISYMEKYWKTRERQSYHKSREMNFIGALYRFSFVCRIQGVLQDRRGS